MADDKGCGGWNVEKIVNHMSLMYSVIGERYHDTFAELAKNDPAKAVQELPAYIGKTLSAGDSFFSGMMCGGPHEAATTPLFNSIGLVYPCLDLPLRERAFRHILRFLDGLNYFNSQQHVEILDEPWLVSDIIANRWLYWPGYKKHTQRLQGLATWDDFEREFIKDGTLDTPSLFWLSFAISRPEYCPDPVRQGYTEQYPELVDRTQDGIAALINAQALDDGEGTRNAAYEATLKEKVTHYGTAWRPAIREKLAEEKWLLLPETIDRITRRPKS